MCDMRPHAKLPSMPNVNPRRLLRDVFRTNAYMRMPNRERQKEEGQAYKKGYEVRLVVATLREAAQIRRSLKEVGLKGGKPFKKANQWVQPVYGQTAVEYFRKLAK